MHHIFRAASPRLRAGWPALFGSVNGNIKYKKFQMYILDVQLARNVHQDGACVGAREYHLRPRR